VVSAEAPKDAALTPKARPGPPRANNAPPSAGPSSLDVLPAAELRPFAQARSASSTRLGIDAEAASQYGNATTVAMNPIAASRKGARTTTRKPQVGRLNRSDAIMRRRRSYRSASFPANGVRSPATPNVKKRVPASQSAEFVR